MDPKAFRFNGEVQYKPGVRSAGDKSVALAQAHVQVRSNDVLSTSFEALYPDIFEDYRLPQVSSDKLVQAWTSAPLQFWQNQLNFAIWCATTGCGVSSGDHLNAEDPMIRSLYRFHVYYQTRRILTEIQAPLPQDQAWHAMNNSYDRRAYERICNEFGVSPHSDFRVSGPNRGLGRVYFYVTRTGYRPVYGLGDPDHYNPSKMSFTKKTSDGVLHVDFIKQDAPGAEEAWRTFILDKSEGYTRPGVERLNDSIRTYVWALLGAQAQTRTGILGTGTAFDAQKQFAANVEDAISSPVDLPSAIKRYQDVLMYAGSEVNFVFGTGLYMAPSDMLLQVGRITGYNNEIVIATEAQRLGLNSGINDDTDRASTIAPPDAANDTGERGIVNSDPAGSTVLEVRQHAHDPDVPAPQAHQHARRHEDEKTALVVGSIAIGLAALWHVKK